MLNKIRLKLIKILMPRKDISTILISLGFAEEEHIRRYNNPSHIGYKSESLEESLRDLGRLQKYWAYMLGIKNYKGDRYENEQ